MFPERFLWIFPRALCFASLVCTFPGSCRMVPFLCSSRSSLVGFLTPQWPWSVIIEVCPSLVRLVFQAMTSLSSDLCLYLFERGSAWNASALSGCSCGTGGLNNLSRLYATLAAVFAVVATTPLTLSSSALCLFL